MKEKEIEIIALEYPDNVRTRPGMFIGATLNPDVILREVIDNASDELMGSQVCNNVDIQLKTGQNGGWYVVSDNGRGIPIKWDEEKNCTKTELAVATLNAGSKFNKSSDMVSVGLNGVGVSCTNALSERFVVLSKITEQNARTSTSDVEAIYNQLAGISELFYVLEYSKGIKIRETASTKEDAEEFYGFKFPENMSTIVAFIPDPTIWKSTVANYSVKSLSYLHVILEKFYKKTATLTIDGVKVDNSFTPYKYEFLKEVKVPDKDRVKQCRFYVNFEVDKDMSVQDSSGSVNSLIVDRGVHIVYSKNAWNEALKEVYSINHNYTLSGLKINVIAMCGEIDFSSQTKENCVKLDGIYTAEAVPQLVQEFKKVIIENKDYFDEHIERLTEYANSLIQISTINRIKQMVVVEDGTNTRSRSKLPANVRDAASRDRKNCELFICEGKSAAGTILRARDVNTQAVIELRGVPMNSINRALEDVLNNEEMCAIISAIGCGVNEYHNTSNPRYGKIIIAADADSDGGRISSMILGMIAHKMTFLIREGFVYVLNSPLYKQDNNYIYPTDNISEKLDRTKPYLRFKGLGEVSVQDAKRIIVGDERNLIKITLDNVEYALNLLTMTNYRKNLMFNKGIVKDLYNTGII